MIITVSFCLTVMVNPSSTVFQILQIMKLMIAIFCSGNESADRLTDFVGQGRKSLVFATKRVVTILKKNKFLFFWRSFHDQNGKL